MGLIYSPRGRAGEYSPLALNVYTEGCDHGCDFCYCKRLGKWTTMPKPRNLKGLEKEAAKAKRQVLLSFMGDPFCRAEETHGVTMNALRILKAEGCSVAILTKGGTRCFREIDAFTSWPDGRIKVGASLTFDKDEKSLLHEPGAALPGERLEALEYLHRKGVRTWASIEPVLEASESLWMIHRSLPWTDEYALGKVSGVSPKVDWGKYLASAIEMLRGNKKRFYVKVDLQRYATNGFLRDRETNPETLFLEDRS